MSLATDCQNPGIQLSDPSFDDPLPADFAVSSNAASMVMLAGWWTVNWNAPGMEGLAPYTTPLSPSSGAWIVSGTKVVVGPAAFGGVQRSIDHNRDLSDYQRPVYLAALLTLRDIFPDFNFDEWIALFRARPLRDPVADQLTYMKASRPMASVFIGDSSRNPTDVLVLDERGMAAQAGNDPWLSRARADFTIRRKVPPLADYVNWLSGQQPYGGNVMFGPNTFTGSGFLSDVAASLLSARRVGV